MMHGPRMRSPRANLGEGGRQSIGPLGLGLVVLLLFLAGLVIVHDLNIGSSFGESEFLEEFFPHEIAVAVKSIDFMIDAGRSGYFVAARATLHHGDVHNVLDGLATRAELLRTNAPPTMLACYDLRIQGMETEWQPLLSAQEESDLRETAWWDLAELQDVNAWGQHGGNSLTTSFVHWWILVERTDKDILYLVGHGS